MPGTGWVNEEASSAFSVSEQQKALCAETFFGLSRS
jgi:hypothetical protein